MPLEQAAHRKIGHPWALCKSFPGACPLGNAAALADPAQLDHMRLRLTINGETRQEGHTGDMIFKVREGSRGPAWCDLLLLTVYTDTVCPLTPPTPLGLVLSLSTLCTLPSMRC